MQRDGERNQRGTRGRGPGRGFGFTSEGGGSPRRVVSGGQTRWLGFQLDGSGCCVASRRWGSKGQKRGHRLRHSFHSENDKDMD